MIDGKTFELRTVNSKDDGIIRQYQWSDGRVYGCTASVTNNAIHIAQGYFFARGRQVFLPGGHDISVSNLITSGYLRLKFVIDLTGYPSADNFMQGYFEWETNTSNAFPDLVREEINISGTKFETDFGVYSIAGSKLTGVVSQPPVSYRYADKLNGKFEYQLSVASAANASKLNGKTESELTVANSSKLNGKTESELTVANSSKLNGKTEFELSVLNAARLGSKKESELSVANAATLGGKSESALTVYDSQRLGGLLPDEYAHRPTMGAQTIYVNPNGSDAEGRGTQNAPYRTLQYAYDNIPEYWYDPVTIQLSGGEQKNANNYIAFENTLQKNSSVIRIVGTDNQSGTADNGTRFYGKFILHEGMQFIVSGVTIFPPYNNFDQSVVQINECKARFSNGRIMSGQSSYNIMDSGRLVSVANGGDAMFKNITFSRAKNAVQATGSIVILSDCTFAATIEVPMLSYDAAIISFSGTNSATGLPYKSKGVMYINGAQA